MIFRIFYKKMRKFLNFLYFFLFCIRNVRERQILIYPYDWKGQTSFTWNRFKTQIDRLNLQSNKQPKSTMFNPVQFYNPWQAPIIFFTPIMGNYQAMSIPGFEYKISQVENGSVGIKNDQLLTQIGSLGRKQAVTAQTKRSEMKKREKPRRQVEKKKKVKEVTEVQVRTVPVQKPIGKKRKSNSKLNFDIEWKNENRNIIPNIMNQMLSFVEKKHKSEWLIVRLFEKYSHSENWTIAKYYCYMKRMKSSMGHYINENELQAITRIQEPECEIYSSEEQMFYLKICRIAIDYFFKTQSILISLTSNRMSEQKRKAHLVARRALLQRMQQLLQQIIN